MTSTLVVEELQVSVARGGPAIVEDVSFSLEPGEVLGVVGESGSGKTTMGMALLGRERPGTRVTHGTVRVLGTDILRLPENERRPLRGKLISYAPQEAATALNPSLRIGSQIREILRVHAPDRNTDSEVTSLFAAAGLPNSRRFLRRFPHQLSGGQQQRVVIAAALAGRPAIVVLDEPTTGLDVATQALILTEIRRLRAELGICMVYISHDLAVVGAIADRVMVMYSGRVVEAGPIGDVLQTPRHPYTHGLLSSVPDYDVPRRLRGIAGVAVGIGNRPAGCAFEPRCTQAQAVCREAVPKLEETVDGRSVRCYFSQLTPPLKREPMVSASTRTDTAALLEVSNLTAEHRSAAGRTVATHDVSFTIQPSEAVALVGESGSGKTTIARCIAGLHVHATGQLAYAGASLPWGTRTRPRDIRRQIQIVFQNPYDSLNPRRTVRAQVARPARMLRRLSRADAIREADAMLEQVRLPPGIGSRFPDELSGGERQRVAIARALITRPNLLVCDEITSALDVSVQAAVLELLIDLRARLDLALLVISHDLGVVASIADRVIVLKDGRIREYGRTWELLSSPQDPYTKMLLRSAPRLVRNDAGGGALDAIPS
ncbi:MAG: ABC transporter ATP-binding protein [Acidimicrobiales bacterium]|jgi:oligopeptide/dipeptide ABC transporter ATP-binding protein